MTVTYRGFSLTADQIDRLLTHALDQLLAGLPLGQLGRPATRRKAVKVIRRGRPALTAAERRAASKRMKAVWDARRKAGKAGRLDT